MLQMRACWHFYHQAMENLFSLFLFLPFWRFRSCSWGGLFSWFLCFVFLGGATGRQHRRTSFTDGTKMITALTTIFCIEFEVDKLLLHHMSFFCELGFFYVPFVSVVVVICNLVKSFISERIYAEVVTITIATILFGTKGFHPPIRILFNWSDCIPSFLHRDA